MRALVVVAHPDDETIWMGGKILFEKGWEWTIVSLCRKDDPDRKPKFFKVCSELGAKSFMSDLDDDNPEMDLKSMDEVVKRLEPVVMDKHFDFVFTHAPNGEYGHLRHKEVGEAVLKMVEQGLIDCESLYNFSYKPEQDPFRAVPDFNASELFNLSRDLFEKKKYLINEVYGFDKNSFEYISCSDVEAFVKVI